MVFCFVLVVFLVFFFENDDGSFNSKWSVRLECSLSQNTKPG